METPTDESVAVRFGRLVAELATRLGYDLRPGQGGRAALARDTGMSPSAVGRMLEGKTLPRPNQFEALARALKTDVRNLLVTGNVISEKSWPKHPHAEVISASSQKLLTPEAAADAWEITDPVIRRMLLGNIEQAIALQREARERMSTAPGGP